MADRSELRDRVGRWWAEFREALTHMFVFSHVIFITLWSLPTDVPLRTQIVSLITPYMLASGLWQGWNMFAPEPLAANTQLQARIVFTDGSNLVWTAPAAHSMGYWERVWRERNTKYVDNVRGDGYEVAWLDLCRWLARQHQRPTNPPTRITLIRGWADIPAPLPRWRQPHDRSAEVQWHHEDFYTYEVTAGDFR